MLHREIIWNTHYLEHTDHKIEPDLKNRVVKISLHYLMNSSLHCFFYYCLKCIHFSLKFYKVAKKGLLLNLKIMYNFSHSGYGL